MERLGANDEGCCYILEKERNRREIRYFLISFHLGKYCCSFCFSHRIS